MAGVSAQPAGRSAVQRVKKALLIFALLLVVLATFAYGYNNYSLAHTSRAQFDARLDPALDRAIDWITRNPSVSFGNPSVMYMIADMAKMSGDARLRAMMNDYAAFLEFPSRPLDPIWWRLIDRSHPLPAITTHYMRGEDFERRWDAYAVAPNNVGLSPAERANMFSPTKYYWGARHHQLFSLVMYRDFNGGNPELNQTMNYLSEKIARDQHYDFRVSDSYLQRIAFVLGAQRPDLIRSRWVERLLDNQQPDGSWKYCWYGWCRGIFEFGLTNPGHPTVQAAWALTMLKYRYPQWIEEHYKP